MIRNFEEMLLHAKTIGKKKIAVACAQDEDVLKAVENARSKDIADAILVGDQEKICEILKSIGADCDKYEVRDIKDLAEASLEAVRLVSSGEADLVMKGLVDTSIILKAVLNKEVGLRTGNVLSHVALFKVEDFPRLLVITDAAMNIAPDLEAKKQIIENSLAVTKALEIDLPKVAVLCAKEKVNPKMPATVEAKELEDMNKAGRIEGCIVQGPMALDNAISKEAAEHKGITGEVAGEADILLCPNIEAGNIFYKALAFLSKSKSAGVIVGAKAPIILTSRADSSETKLNSIVLGVLMADKM
ncbi:MAG: phosphate butyryltransferase [Firmicutes bacterium]|nr:phosphate butyryltransferase [Bacillota bacterium]